MASPPLVVRNLTSVPVTLTIVEHIEATPSQASSRTPGGIASTFSAGISSLSNITKGVADLVTNETTAPPEGPHIADDAQPFKTNETSIEVAPFAIQKTQIKPTIKSDNEVLRLTFEVSGQKYKIVCPSPKDESQSFTTPAKNPKHHLTGVFLPKSSQLTIFSSADLDSWMQHLSSSLPLSSLSIPGTHDTPTCYKALPSVRCQAVGVREQLDNGIRFFDIRVQTDDPNSDKLELVHGVFPISLTGPKHFRDLLNDTVAFLEAHPSETIVMSMKREGTGNGTDQQLAKVLYDHYCGPQAPGSDKWYTSTEIPTLGEARGKIVLLRRFGLGDDVKNALGPKFGGGWGMNAESWADNTPCDTNGAVCVQDFYEVLETENIDKKIDYAKAQCERAGEVAGPAPGGGHDARDDHDDHDEQGHDGEPGQRGGGGGRGGRGGRGGGRGGRGGGGQGGGQGGKKPPFYLNFLSASNFWKAGCWPEKIAAQLNPAMVEHLCLKHHLDFAPGRGMGGTGIMILDWVGYQGDWDLVRCIVGMNAKLESVDG